MTTKEEDIKLDLIEAQQKMGFQVLLNQAQFIEKEGKRIALGSISNTIHNHAIGSRV